MMVYFSGGLHEYGCSRLAAAMSLVDVSRRDKKQCSDFSLSKMVDKDHYRS